MTTLQIIFFVVSLVWGGSLAVLLFEFLRAPVIENGENEWSAPQQVSASRHRSPRRRRDFRQSVAPFSRPMRAH